MDLQESADVLFGSRKVDFTKITAVPILNIGKITHFTQKNSAKMHRICYNYFINSK